MISYNLFIFIKTLLHDMMKSNFIDMEQQWIQEKQ